MVRIPLPSGKYITRSVTPEGDELSTIAKCKEVRDALAIPIWGKEEWHKILSVPARSTTRPRVNPTTPYNGVVLKERPGKASRYEVAWYELDIPDGSVIESQTHGKRVPRKKKVKTFSFGTDKARFTRQEDALSAAIALAKTVQAQHYSVIHSRDKNSPPIFPVKG
tara:strand:+ start:1246 stop:1743 length:498 start_codon:yes stop_codon:yes gene_type:complete